VKWFTDSPFESLLNASLLDELTDRDIYWMLQESTRLFVNQTYAYTQTKSAEAKEKIEKSVTFFLQDDIDEEFAEDALLVGESIGEGMLLTRKLGDLPPNICTPSYLVQTAQALAEEFDMDCRVIEFEEAEEMGMGAFCCVAQGSTEPAKIIILEYKGGADDEEPIALVGKGVTFDTGGISLKPGAGMDEMKFDMLGAGSVLGTLKAVAYADLPINLVVAIPTTENMPSGHAARPGDVVTSLSGQTIEILNTDAEGRLILCDTLTLVQDYNPRMIVDVATLTGACIVALGSVNSGLMSNSDLLAQELMDAGEETLDSCWRMPLSEEYDSQLDSNFADMANIGGPKAGTITAGCFLARFVKDQTWAHLDIAGTAWNQGKEKGATGRPVPLLTQFIINQLADEEDFS
jgi:leucyl aminopeptidase